jgi:hypothetical protein
MKHLRSIVPAMMLSIAIGALAQSEMKHSAQSETQKPVSPQQSAAQKPVAVKTEAQLSFEKLKKLEGSWQARISTVPPTPEIDGKVGEVTLRVTSMGNALMHEMKMEGRPDDPITMLYLDADRLMLTHFCDAGNRPRMVAKPSGGNIVQFDFLDVTGNMKYGHMHNAAFTVIDENHHTEEWTFMQGDKPVRARFELTRKGSASASAK